METILLQIAIMFCAYQWGRLIALLITYYGLPRVPFIERIKQRRAEKRWHEWWASLPADRQQQISAGATQVANLAGQSGMTADQAAKALRDLSQL